MTAFTKGSWTIEYMPGAPITQTGYKSKSFGIHKRYDRWCVTHLASGLEIGVFGAKTLAAAKSIVTDAEARFDWSQGKDVYELAERNGFRPRAFYDACRELGRSKAA